MAEILKYLNENPTIQIVIFVFGVLGWIVGIISASITAKSYQSQKKLEGAYRVILEKAQRDWQGKYTEEQIRALTSQFKSLERQIRKEIPLQAKRTFLEDQFHTTSTTLVDLYQKYKRIQEDLGEISTRDDLPPAIKQAIENEIEPSYLAGRRQQRTSTLLLIFVIILLIFPFIKEYLLMAFYGPARAVGLYFPTEYIASYVGGIILAIYFASLIPIQKYRLRILNHKIFTLIIGVTLLVIWVSILWLTIYEPNYLDMGWEALLAIVSLVPFAISIKILYYWIRNVAFQGNLSRGN